MDSKFKILLIAFPKNDRKHKRVQSDEHLLYCCDMTPPIFVIYKKSIKLAGRNEDKIENS